MNIKKEAVNTATSTFEVGKEYLAWHNKSASITIIKRTPKTVTFINVVNGETSPFGASTKRIKIVNGSEYFVDGIFCYQADQLEESPNKAVEAVEPLSPQPTPTIPAVEGNSEPEAVSAPELELVEVLAETAPEPQPIDRVSELETELFKVRELLTSTRKLADTLEAEACRLTVQITAANLNQLKNKAEVKQITLTRDEGTIAESGVAVTATGWLEAERTLKQWAKTVGSPTRADKCRILFEFADGESFELLSFNLMQKHRFGVNLAQELLAELQHLAGEVIPAHMTQEDYRNYCKFCKIDPSIYKRLLDRWVIPA